MAIILPKFSGCSVRSCIPKAGTAPPRKTHRKGATSWIGGITYAAKEYVFRRVNRRISFVEHDLNQATVSFLGTNTHTCQSCYDVIRTQRIVDPMTRIAFGWHTLNASAHPGAIRYEFYTIDASACLRKSCRSDVHPLIFGLRLPGAPHEMRQIRSNL